MVDENATGAPTSTGAGDPDIGTPLERYTKYTDELQAEYDEKIAKIDNECQVCGGDMRNHSQAQLSKCTSEADAYSPEDIVKNFEKSYYYTPSRLPIQVATLKVLLEIRDLLKKSKN